MIRYDNLESNEILVADTQEECISRLQQMKQYGSIEEETKIMVQRERAPLWFCRLVKETFFEFLAYREVK